LVVYLFNQPMIAVYIHCRVKTDMLLNSEFPNSLKSLGVCEVVRLKITCVMINDKQLLGILEQLNSRVQRYVVAEHWLDATNARNPLKEWTK